MSSSRIDDTRRVRVFECYEKIGDEILQYSTLDPTEYVPHKFIAQKKESSDDNKRFITKNGTNTEGI